MNKIKQLIHIIFGHCEMCNNWFVYPKRRRMSTMYNDEEMNYCKVCKHCYNQIEEYWQERWDEYYSSRGI